MRKILIGIWCLFFGPSPYNDVRDVRVVGPLRRACPLAEFGK